MMWEGEGWFREMGMGERMEDCSIGGVGARMRKLWNCGWEEGG